jgi:hypothetical protein
MWVEDGYVLLQEQQRWTAGYKRVVPVKVIFGRSVNPRLKVRSSTKAFMVANKRSDSLCHKSGKRAGLATTVGDENHHHVREYLKRGKSYGTLTMQGC